MRLARLAAYWMISGSTIFLIWADYDTRIWNNVYFIWDATRDFLFSLALFYLLPKASRFFMKPVNAFLIIRLIWEIVNSLIFVQNKQKIESIGFLVLSVGVALLLLKDLIDRWEQNS